MADYEKNKERMSDLSNVNTKKQWDIDVYVPSMYKGHISFHKGIAQLEEKAKRPPQTYPNQKAHIGMDLNINDSDQKQYQHPQHFNKQKDNQFFFDAKQILKYDPSKVRDLKYMHSKQTQQDQESVIKQSRINIQNNVEKARQAAEIHGTNHQFSVQLDTHDQRQFKQSVRKTFYDYEQKPKYDDYGVIFHGGEKQLMGRRVFPSRARSALNDEL